MAGPEYSYRERGTLSQGGSFLLCKVVKLAGEEVFTTQGRRNGTQIFPF